MAPSFKGLSIQTINGTKVQNPRHKLNEFTPIMHNKVTGLHYHTYLASIYGILEHKIVIIK